MRPQVQIFLRDEVLQLLGFQHFPHLLPLAATLAAQAGRLSALAAQWGLSAADALQLHRDVVTLLLAHDHRSAPATPQQ